MHITGFFYRHEDRSRLFVSAAHRLVGTHLHSAPLTDSPLLLKFPGCQDDAPGIIPPPYEITFMTIHINIYRPKLSALYQRDGMVQRLWQKWSRF